MALRLSPAVTFHARGEDCFAWHGDTGDVCQMSRDVVGLMCAFDAPRGADREQALAATTIEPETAARFVELLVERGYLLDPGRRLNLSERRPFVPRLTVWERRRADAVVHGRERSVVVPGGAALLEAAEDGERPLEALWPRARFAEIARLCRADLGALKLLPPGTGLPRWASSTMPWPAVDGRALASGQGPPPGSSGSRPEALAHYHDAISDPERQFDEIETTLSHLFRHPHRALGGARFGDRLAAFFVERGLPAAGARVLEVGGGLGWLGAALSERLAPATYLVVDRSPALSLAQRRRGLRGVVGDATALPVGDGVWDLVVSNEMAGDLSGDGALLLVDECARALAPGGVAWISEFGHPTLPPVVSDHLDHDERSIRFQDLRRRAASHGLDASLVPVPVAVGLDPEPRALVTTRASFAALRRLLGERGVVLDKRAWLEDEALALVRQAGLAPSDLHGLPMEPIGDRTMGLKPREFWALVARKAQSEQVA